MRISRDNNLTTIMGRAAATAAILTVMAVPAKALGAPVRLMVDPGHGGKDPGAVSGNAVEKTTNMQISKYVMASAKRQGWAVKATRTTDTFIPLTERTARAKRWKANAMVSIHSNSAGSKSGGHMTIYRSGSDKKLGKAIINELDNLTPYADYGNMKDSRGLAVLRTAKAPTVIVELLSVSSAKERKVLLNKKEQQRMAEAIVKGIAKDKKWAYVPPKSASKPKPKPETKPTTPTVDPKPTTPTAEPKPVEPTKKPTVEPTKPKAPEKAERPADKTPAESLRERAPEPKQTPAAISPIGALLRLLFG